MRRLGATHVVKRPAHRKVRDRERVPPPIHPLRLLTCPRDSPGPPARVRRTLTFHGDHKEEEDDEAEEAGHEGPPARGVTTLNRRRARVPGRGDPFRAVPVTIYENLIVAYSWRKPKRIIDEKEKEDEEEKEEHEMKEETEEMAGGRSEVPTYDNRDLLVNIGRRDGSWESARGENKDTRCSDTDNDQPAGGSA